MNWGGKSGNEGIDSELKEVHNTLDFHPLEYLALLVRYRTLSLSKP